MTSTGSPYLLANAGADAPARLSALASMFDATTQRHLLGRGVGPGWHCLEVGGGGGSIASWLANRVLPDGRVVATDLDTRFLETLSIPNLEVRRHDIVTDSLPESTFDLIHVRLVLVHLSQWESVLERLVAALKPGGWLVDEEFDSDSLPPDPVTSPGEVLLKTYTGTARLMTDHGFDRRFGRRLFARLRAKGLVNVAAEARIEMLQRNSPGVSLMRANYQQLRGEMIDAGYVTAEEVDRDLSRLDDPDFLMPSSIMSNHPLDDDFATAKIALRNPSRRSQIMRQSGERPMSGAPTGVDRRGAVTRISSFLAAAAAWPRLSVTRRPTGEHHEAPSSAPTRRLRKIATEEAFTIPEVSAAMLEVVRRGGPALDLKLWTLVYNAAPVEPTLARAPSAAGVDRDALARQILPRLLDVEHARLAEMDASGVDVHLLSLVSPGVQMLERDTAVSLARLSNDRLSETIRRHPTRFAGLACFAPQDPAAAAKEMERAIQSLKLNGFLVNSHTNGVYLDDQRCWPILEAAEALDAPLYIHPRAPSDGMAAPFRDYRLEGSIWGYGMETGTHAVRLMLSGVLDRFPRLRIVLGHMGEALPFWMWRLDYMASPGSRAALKNSLKPSEYMQRNFSITTSGLEDPLALRYVIEKIGVERVMWAIDYPFQQTEGSVAFIESAPLSETEREQIAHRNAERIFRIADWSKTDAGSVAGRVGLPNDETTPCTH